MKLIAPIHRARATCLLAALSFVTAFQYAACDPPVELLDSSDSAAYVAESQACPDCGCELSGVQCGHGSPCARCCRGRNVCCPTVEEATEERSCWKVTCEKVCVPAIRLPWEPGGSKLTLFSWLRPRKCNCHCGQHVEYVESCAACARLRAVECAPKCGPVRCVSVLESESYEVKVCRCKWDIRHLPGCCDDGCSDFSEAKLFEDEAATDATLPAPE